MRTSSLLAALGCSLALSACVAGPPPEIATPAPELPPAFLYAPEPGVEANVAALLPYGDPAFAALSARLLAENPTLGEALARIDAARAEARRAGANRLPLLTGGADVTASRTNPDQFGGDVPQGAPGGGIDFDTERVSYGATLGASWDADLFGRLRARERAAVALADARSADAAAVRIALLSELAGAVIDWRTLADRERALRQDLDAAQRLVDLSASRERAGLNPGFDTLRAQGTAAATRTRLAALESERARILGRIVTLTAQGGTAVAGALALGEGDTSLPAAPAATPSLLLANRPDVAAASSRLAASDAQLAATAAERFPQLTLSAALGLLAFDIGSLFDEDAIVGSLTAAIAAPLLDFGRIEAQIDGAAAEKRAAFQAYRGAVYTALGEAEAAYATIAAADAETAAAAREEAMLARSARLADTRYRAGLSDFLTVLEARRAADAAGERLAIATGRAKRARVLLWQALGGDPQAESAIPASRSISQ